MARRKIDNSLNYILEQLSDVMGKAHRSGGLEVDLNQPVLTRPDGSQQLR